jgi:hypothetical protein
MNETDIDDRLDQNSGKEWSGFRRRGSAPILSHNVGQGRLPRAFVSYGREWGMEKLIVTKQVRS